MKSILVGLLCAFAFVGCSSTAKNSRMPSSVDKKKTFLGKGVRIILKQPVPFINAGGSKQTVEVKSRRSFFYDGADYFCSLSAQVPKQNTYFFDEGTVFEFKEQSSLGANNLFQPKKGTPVNLTCQNATTGERKKAITLEEAQTAFPLDVLVIEQTSSNELFKDLAL
jgi:hypothetical protein